MHIECHFIRTFHYVSVYFILNSPSLNCCPSLHTRSSNLARRFPTALLAMSSGIAEICFRIAILRSSMVCVLVVYTSAEATPKDIIRDRDIRRTCTPWKLTAQWNYVLRKSFLNDLYGCCRYRSSCTFLLEPYGRELSSGVRQSLIFQHNEQMWL
jgi:hypothetical protein